jgi:hypothetical protein
MLRWIVPPTPRDTLRRERDVGYLHRALSPKIGDPRRDGHYALDSSINSAGMLIVFLVIGTTELITNPDCTLTGGQDR